MIIPSMMLTLLLSPFLFLVIMKSNPEKKKPINQPIPIWNNAKTKPKVLRIWSNCVILNIMLSPFLISNFRKNTNLLYHELSILRRLKTEIS